jgi:transglutaminase-like putative cysteine protease
MMRTAAVLRLLLAIVLLGLALPAFAAGLPKLSAPPEGERWFSIQLSGERVGFAHLNIVKAEDGYRIDTESSVKMRGMGFAREAATKASYLVGRDLALRSFVAENSIDGSPMTLKGEVTAKGVRVVVESGGSKKERSLKAKGAVYPPEALNIYPLMQGAETGKTYRIAMLDPDSVKVKQVKVEVIAQETVAGIAAVHLQNNLFPIVDNDIWVDLKGNTLKESVRDDLVVTLAEDEKSARLYLANAALSKRDLVLDFSLIRIEPPLERPAQLKKLSVEFTGIPSSQPLLQGKWQQATRLADGKVLFTMPNPAFAPVPAEAPQPSDLEPATRIPSDSVEIIAKKDEILGAVKDPAEAARLLMAWVAKEIKGTVTDSQSPLETLKIRNGNCQSHARLYAALARAAGIPTRFVSGLVYAQGQGFLYHSWAESYLNGWISVDPTFGEMPANLTHIKLVEGDSPDEMGLLAGMIGKVKAKTTERVY